MQAKLETGASTPGSMHSTGARCNVSPLHSLSYTLPERQARRRGEGTGYALACGNGRVSVVDGGFKRQSRCFHAFKCSTELGTEEAGRGRD